MATICRICVTILACNLVVTVVQCKKPHIVLIVADDMGFNDIGYNNKYILTPNLDKLARNGVILNQAYVQQVCSPSRASLLTGYYAYHVGIQNGALGGSSPYGLPLEYTLLPQVLNKLGYKTHMVGKSWICGKTANGKLCTL